MKIKKDISPVTCCTFSSLFVFLAFSLVLGTSVMSFGKETIGEVTYVGSLACKNCHPEEYDNFMTYAKKAHHFKVLRNK